MKVNLTSIIAILGVVFLAWGVWVIASQKTQLESQNEVMQYQLTAIDAKSELNNKVIKQESDGKVRLEIITPKSTEYKGPGEKIERTIGIGRVASPFGQGAGEVLNAEKPIHSEGWTNPSVEVDPDGVHASGSKAGKSDTGGFSQGFFSGIWNWIKNKLWLGVIILAIGAVLFFAVPGLQPILGGVFRAITSVIPVVGAWIAHLFAAAKTAMVAGQLTQVVSGGQTFKDNLDTMQDLTPSQKDAIKKLFNASQQQEQDAETQAAIRQIKINEKL